MTSDAHLDLATLAEQSGTKFILALFVDLRGKPCAKLVPVAPVDLLATESLRAEMRSSRPTRPAFFDRGPGYATLSGGRPNSDLDWLDGSARG